MKSGNHHPAGVTYFPSGKPTWLRQKSQFIISYRKTQINGGKFLASRLDTTTGHPPTRHREIQEDRPHDLRHLPRADRLLLPAMHGVGAWHFHEQTAASNHCQLAMSQY